MKVLHNLGNPVQSSKLALAETESPYNNALTEGDIMASLYKRAEMAYWGYTGKWNGRLVTDSKSDGSGDGIHLSALDDGNPNLLTGYTSPFST